MTAAAWRSLAGAASLRLNIRKIRLVSGLILFAYVAAHFLNHALGNVSVDAMEMGLVAMKAVWQSVPGTIVLYGALLIHGGLGLRALYERRVFRFGRIEAFQLGFGLLIPLILLIHISNTRIAFAVTGFSKIYAQELYSFWFNDPSLGVAQVLMLLVAWIHGCIGIYFWLRLKPFFSRVATLLLCVATLWPAFALLGFYQGGRAILTLANDEGWRNAHLTAIEVGTQAEEALLTMIKGVLVYSYVGAVLAVLAARALRAIRERRRGLMKLTYPERKTVAVPIGLSLLEASTQYEMPHAGVCGGRGRCGTCLVTVLSGLDHCPAPTAAEAEMLQNLRVANRPAMRLGCQLRPLGDVTFAPLLPPRADTNFAYGGGRRIRTGRRRYVACLLVEMRDVAASEDEVAPRETVFLANRFLTCAAQSVIDAGGAPNRVYGAGMLALFGLACDPARACRQAIEAAALLSANLDHLNSLLAGGARMQFVIGLHAGEATIGEIGWRDELAFTAIGSVVRETAALLDLARLMKCEALISEHVCVQAGVRKGVLRQTSVTLPENARTIDARVADRAAMIFGALDAIVDEATRRPEPPGATRLAPV